MGHVLSTMARLLSAFVIATLSLLAIGYFAWVDDRNGVSAYQQSDIATDLGALSERAERGDARAQFELGLMYAKGEGVDNNNVVALKWFECVAESESDAGLARQAKKWRDAIAEALSPTSRREALAMASSSCGVSVGSGTEDRPPAPTFKPSRDGLLQLIVFTPGDLAIAALLGLANAFGLLELREFVYSLFVDYGNTFVGFIAGVCWVLVGLVIIQSIGWFEDFGISRTYMSYTRGVKRKRGQERKKPGEEPIPSQGER